MWLVKALLELEYKIYRHKYSEHADQLRFFLRAKLVRYPYWRFGHLQISELALLDKNYELAHAAAQAADNLYPDSSSQFLLARIYVRNLAFNKAEQILEKLNLFDSNLNIVEELAAVYLATDSLDKLKNLIINSKFNSANLESLKAYLKI